MSPACSLHPFPTHTLPFPAHVTLHCRAGSLSGQAKLDAWERIKALTFTRALAASWMVALLHLLNRVQLNILGRHLYLQNNTQDSQ